MYDEASDTPCVPKSVSRFPDLLPSSLSRVHLFTGGNISSGIYRMIWVKWSICFLTRQAR